jgi:hypothetical protein
MEELQESREYEQTVCAGIILVVGGDLSSLPGYSV